MKKKILAASLATMMALSLAACGGQSKPAETTAAAPAQTKEAGAETKAEAAGTAEAAEAAGEKAPEDYKGTVVVYSPHDADPLNAGVNQ